MINFDRALTRRGALATLGTLGVAAAIPSIARGEIASRSSAQAISDEDIFNFALNLEYLETEYYLLGTTGSGISDFDAGSNPGTVNGGHMVPWRNNDYKQFMEEIARNELAHVKFYRRTLGTKAVSRPELDLKGGFMAAAKAAGLGDNFDPFSSEMNFFLGGMLIEDVGVTLYTGAAPLIQNKDYLQAAAAILAVEAHHMGMVRSTLYRMGKAARDAAGAISDARDKLDGMADLDQGIVMDGKANFVPSDSDGKAFIRTPYQGLRIVYLTDQPGVSQGGLFLRIERDFKNDEVRATCQQV
ncbi:MAG: ferritin-like domain-containing protein [Chlorobia bacterium]|nr:ferritin-like domain-containing protein [Fimbriimonadaceae bacterium]